MARKKANNPNSNCSSASAASVVSSAISSNFASGPSGGHSLDRRDRKSKQHSPLNTLDKQKHQIMRAPGQADASQLGPQLQAGMRSSEAYLQPDDQHFMNFRDQLAPLGLTLRDVAGDGNCLFRALGDQMDGNGGNHMTHRMNTVRFMIAHRQDFESFIDMPFEKYVDNLSRAGTYAGQDALVAFAKFHKVNIVIHQLNSPQWKIEGHPSADRELHLSYHNGEHYSSVRRAGDLTGQPALIRMPAIVPKAGSMVPCCSAGLSRMTYSRPINVQSASPRLASPNSFQNNPYSPQTYGSDSEQSFLGYSSRSSATCAQYPVPMGRAFPIDSETNDSDLDSGVEYAASGTRLHAQQIHEHDQSMGGKAINQAAAAAQVVDDQLLVTHVMDDVDVAQQVLEQCQYNGDLAIEHLLMIKGTGEPTPEAQDSNQEDNNTNKKYKPQKKEEEDKMKAKFGEKKLSNRERKELARKEKSASQAASKIHSNNNANINGNAAQLEENEPVMINHHLGMLNL